MSPLSPNTLEIECRTLAGELFERVHFLPTLCLRDLRDYSAEHWQDEACNMKLITHDGRLLSREQNDDPLLTLCQLQPPTMSPSPFTNSDDETLGTTAED